MMSGSRLWGVHMDASVGTSPVDQNYVAIGWPRLGDLSKIVKDREAFKNLVRHKISEAKPGSVPVQAGVLFRFVYELKEGDLIVYPSKVDRMVNIGKVAGPYKYNPKANADYPNMRPIRWLKHLPREDFSQEALYEIGSFITLFSIRKYANEFVAAANGQSSTEAADSERDTESEVPRPVAEQAEETTQDFVVRQLKTGMDGYQFEHFIGHLLQCMGYHAHVTPKSGDGGVDIVAHRDQLGFEPPIIKVQCKQVTNQIGRPEVTQLHGNVEAGEHGLFVTLGSFSRAAREYGRSKPTLRLVDGEKLVQLIFDNYERIEPRYQALLPLKRIYVPSPKQS